MSTAAYQKKESAMNPEALDRLLGFLDSDREAAERKYERIKDKLTNLFRWRGCPQPREYAAKTIEGGARELLEGTRQQVHDPYLYFHRVAINVSNALKELWAATEKDTAEPAPNGVGIKRVASSEKSSWDSGPERSAIRPPRLRAARTGLSIFAGTVSRDIDGSSEKEINHLERERRLHCLRDCLSTLSIENLELIAKYHQPGAAHLKESRKELARSLGITQAELKVRVFRIRADLTKSVNDCLGRSKSTSPGQNGGYFEH